MFTPDIRLTDAVNEKGSTSFLLSVCQGNISVMEVLLNHRSDPFVRDNKGNTVFTLLCKNSQFWALHYMSSYIRYVILTN